MRNEIKRIERLKGLRLKVRALLEGTLLGVHRSPLHGYSSEFVEHREYSPGDDTRLIDWKVYARKEKLFTKKFSEETNTRVYFLLDSSNSMNFGNPTKFEYAKVLLLSLAYLFQQQRDAPSLFVFSDKERIFIPPSSTRVNIEKITDTLEGLEPEGKTDPFNLFLYLSEIIKKRSLIFLFTDYYHRPGDFLKGLKYLKSRKNEVFSIRVLSREEFNVDKRLPFILKDLETEEEYIVNDRKLWEEIKRKMKEFELKLNEELFSSGIKNFNVYIEDPYEKNLLMIVNSL